LIGIDPLRQQRLWRLLFVDLRSTLLGQDARAGRLRLKARELSLSTRCQRDFFLLAAALNSNGDRCITSIF
jgi:hypothetical protein